MISSQGLMFHFRPCRYTETEEEEEGEEGGEGTPPARSPGGAPEGEEDAVRRLAVLERTLAVARDLTTEMREDICDAEAEEETLAGRCDKARAELQALRASGGSSAMKRAAGEAIRSATARATDILRKGAEEAARLNADAERIAVQERKRAVEEAVEGEHAKFGRLAAGTARMATGRGPYG